MEFLFSTIMHLSQTKSGSWDQCGSQLVIAYYCLTVGRRFRQMILKCRPNATFDLLCVPACQVAIADVEDETIGGSFSSAHILGPLKLHLKDTTSGGLVPDILTALSSLVSTLVPEREDGSARYGSCLNKLALSSCYSCVLLQLFLSVVLLLMPFNNGKSPLMKKTLQSEKEHLRQREEDRVRVEETASAGIVLFFGEIIEWFDGFTLEVNDGSDVWKNQQLLGYSKLYPLGSVNRVSNRCLIISCENFVKKLWVMNLPLRFSECLSQDKIADSRHPTVHDWLESIEMSLNWTDVSSTMKLEDGLANPPAEVDLVCSMMRYGCLVADSKFMKVAFGVDFKILIFNPLVFSTKDLSRNLKSTVYVVPTGLKIYLGLDLHYVYGATEVGYFHVQKDVYQVSFAA
ncbi:hypothetical protein Tco_0138960 [Tanacetum coccineum]